MAPENRIHHRKSSGGTSRSDRKENRRRRLAALFLACVILAAGGIPVAGGTVSAGETGAVAVPAGADIGSNSRTVRAGIFHFDGYQIGRASCRERVLSHV